MATTGSLETAQQRYYRRNRQRLLAELKGRYHNDPEFRAHALDPTRRWRQANPKKARAIQRARYLPDRERLLAENKARYQTRKVSDPEAHARKLRKVEEAYLQRQYNMTLKQFDELWHKQAGCCALCGEQLQRRGKMGSEHVVVDHCHKTERVRGLLHNRCNRLLGQAQDRADILLKAATYIQKFKQSTC